MSLELTDEFQNQVDFYLDHDRRTFTFYNFHSHCPRPGELIEFHVLLERALKNSGFIIIKEQETYPPVYMVSRVDEFFY